jgi:hypothetical protein
MDLACLEPALRQPLPAAQAWRVRIVLDDGKIDGTQHLPYRGGLPDLPRPLEELDVATGLIGEASTDDAVDGALVHDLTCGLMINSM